MIRRRVIIDCDPGLDDAINLFLAFASPEALEIVGITTVAGNVPVALTERNARMVRELANREDVPVFGGCERPLRRPPVYADHVHGASGVDGMTAFEPRAARDDAHAVDWLVETLRAANAGEITLVATGPLTNLAAAFARAPDVLPKIAEVVLMGGARREGGNITPTAEFNMFADPHAAAAVFACGRPIVAIGLDATHQATATPERLAPLRAISGPVAEAALGMLEFANTVEFKRRGAVGAPVHDPCTVAYLLAPRLFATKPCCIQVETEAALTLGCTSVDYWGATGNAPNAVWVDEVDADALFALIAERISRL